MANDIEFINGLSFKAPNDNAPEYVKGKGWIKNAELIAYLQNRIANGQESTNFDVKVSQGGKWYAAVDNWKPNGNGSPRNNAPQPARRDPQPQAFEPDNFQDQDIPFISARGVF